MPSGSVPSPTPADRGEPGSWTRQLLAGVPYCVRKFCRTIATKISFRNKIVKLSIMCLLNSLPNESRAWLSEGCWHFLSYVARRLPVSSRDALLCACVCVCGGGWGKGDSPWLGALGTDLLGLRHNWKDRIGFWLCWCDQEQSRWERARYDQNTSNISGFWNIWVSGFGLHYDMLRKWCFKSKKGKRQMCGLEWSPF